MLFPRPSLSKSLHVAAARRRHRPFLSSCSWSSSSTTTASFSTTTTSTGNPHHDDDHPAYEFEQLREQLLSSSSPPQSDNHDDSSAAVEFITNPYELDRHGRGESYHPIMRPDLVVKPRTTAQIQTIMKYCFHHKIPIVPFGAGTSVEGHVTALHGGLSLDMAHFQAHSIPDLSSMTTNSGSSSSDDDEATAATATMMPDPIATVGAGVTRHQLNDALRHTGLHFVVDPGADATLGGMVSTNASGTTTTAYGGMRANLLALECVLPDADATIVRLGTHALKNSAGYDLLSLMCGSEGTLGVITSVTVKLHPLPTHVVAAVCVFDSLAHAAQAVATIKLHALPVARCELLDTLAVQAFNHSQKDTSGIDPMVEKPTLFLEFHGSSATSLEEQVAMTQSICEEEFGGSSFQFTSDEKQRKVLWGARHKLTYACYAARPGSTAAFITDACVPLSRFAELAEATTEDVRVNDVVGICFGHAGDGNLHCIMPLRPDEDPAYLRRVHRVNENIIKRAQAFGGTCTGEHGVGYGKIPYLKAQYGEGTIHMMEAVKRAIDPHNIMNPGKIVLLSTA